MTAPVYVLDTATPVPGAAVYAAGYAGVVRYIGTPGDPRCVTRQELHDVTAYGLGVALVYASVGGDWRGGYPAGHASATLARSHASSIGHPDGRPLYFPVPDASGPGRDYLAGAADAVGVDCVGVYGGRDVVTMARATGVACFFWQHAPGESTTIDAQLIHLGEKAAVAGVSCGVSVAHSLDWGQYVRSGSAPAMVEAVVAAAEHLSDSAVRRLATVYAGELARRRTRM